jgi:Zn finger protein HypA/HybF involved in hydrogenase expression
MPIAPQPFKYKCPQCGYSKIVKPKSDVFDPRDMFNICPKCKSEMERQNLNFIDKLFRMI